MFQKSRTFIIYLFNIAILLKISKVIRMMNFILELHIHKVNIDTVLFIKPYRDPV